MKTKLWALGLMVLCTLFTSSAQLFYKAGADKLEFNFMSMISNWSILIGLLLYGFGAVLLIIALKGGSLTVLYPIIASSYIWVALGSDYFFGETINISKWAGVMLITTGIIIINLGDIKITKFKKPI